MPIQELIPNDLYISLLLLGILGLSLPVLVFVSARGVLRSGGLHFVVGAATAMVIAVVWGVLWMAGRGVLGIAPDILAGGPAWLTQAMLLLAVLAVPMALVEEGGRYLALRFVARTGQLEGRDALMVGLGHGIVVPTLAGLFLCTLIVLAPEVEVPHETASTAQRHFAHVGAGFSGLFVMGYVLMRVAVTMLLHGALSKVVARVVYQGDARRLVVPVAINAAATLAFAGARHWDSGSTVVSCLVAVAALVLLRMRTGWGAQRPSHDVMIGSGGLGG